MYSHVEKCPPVNKVTRIPATFLHVSFDLVHVDLGVQQGGEMCRAGLGGFSHLQVVQFQPEV